MSKITECPMCKSTDGYQYKFLTEYLQQCSFDGEEIWTEQTGNFKEFKTKTCIECGYNLTRHINNTTNELTSAIGEEI